MSTKKPIAVDLFCGAGGFSTGAAMAGVDVAWACDFDREALSWHEANHPAAVHALRDLAPMGQEPDPSLFDDVPEFDLLLASPCCQGHSSGLGGAKRALHAASRATAWAPVVLLEARRPKVMLVENVPELAKWEMFPRWKERIAAAGYRLVERVVDASSIGVPQARKRLFVLAVRDDIACGADFPLPDAAPMVPAMDMIDWDKGKWSPLDNGKRSDRTIRNIKKGMDKHGARFVYPFYGRSGAGRSALLPLGTITRKDKWCAVRDGMIRMFSREEYIRCMGFPSGYRMPPAKTAMLRLLGNGVCPEVARVLVGQLLPHL